MKSRWLIVVALSLHFVGVCSQNNSPSLFLKHYGLWDDPYLIMYITNNATTADSVEVMTLANYFMQNRAEILNYADMSTLHSLYIDPKRLEITPRMRQQTNEMIASMGQSILSGIANYQEQQAHQAQLEAQRKVEIQEKYNRNMEIAMQNGAKQAAQFNAMQNSSYTTTSSTPLFSSANQAQSNNYKMETCDPDKHMAIQMSISTIGLQATQEALRLQEQNNYESKKTGGYGGHIIYAVTANRRAVTIQVRDKQIGGRIIAYSLGADISGKQQWIGTEGAISKCTTTLEFQYTGYIRDLGDIYFNM